MNNDPVVRPRPGGRLAVYSLGLARHRALKAALAAHGARLVFGPFARRPEGVAVWGAGPVADRGVRAAARRVLPCLYLEDALFRSVAAGPGEPVIGLMADWQAPYYEARAPNDLITLLKRQPVVLSSERARAEALIGEIRRAGLSKYNAPGRAEAAAPGYVLLVDQVKGDGAIAGGKAGPQTFAEMLKVARAENPDARIVIRRHPRGAGHFGPADLGDGVEFEPYGVPADKSIDAAAAVYVVTSTMGFEAVLRGKRPRVFGMPFYAGWGLTSDEMESPDRGVRHDIESLAHRVLVDYALWVDPYTGRSSGPEMAIRSLAARKAGAARRARPRVLTGFSSWKRPHMRAFLGKVRFSDAPIERLAARAKAKGEVVTVWASRAPAGLEMAAERHGLAVERVEDGFLRSKGLGAALHVPLSLAVDDLGIHYDPEVESRLERHLASAPDLDAGALARARLLRERIVAKGLSKYNQGGASGLPAREPGRVRVLVPGQVEDDASMIHGAGPVSTNAGLLEAVRAANPQAQIIYKPHPDVVAGLRRGQLPRGVAGELADVVLRGGDPAAVLAEVDAVHTMTSLIGFEALMRGLPVVVYGRPFYAGWGLTEDLGGDVPRRRRRLTLDQLVHEALISYPVYLDPVSGLDAPPEAILNALATGDLRRGMWRAVAAGLQRLGGGGRG